MRTIALDDAAERIHSSRAAAHGPSPYFFVVGAGISIPSVPLSRTIEEECRAMAGEAASAPDDPAQRYAFWIERALPDPVQRRDYFREKIEGRPLTEANLRLAHLLLSKAITGMVVTPNFDDLLSRSLALLGARPLICDHPATTVRVDPLGDDLSVVHVHGSYWFYDLVNTLPEITSAAIHDPEAPSMAQLVDTLLASRSPLVCGYAGWEGDVLMSALKRRLKHGLKHNLYWFCYKRSDADNLPKWLRDHRNVWIVTDEVETLPADRVFDALLARFAVQAPALTRDPLGFFAKQLRDALPPGSDVEAPARSVYFLDRVVHRIENAAKREREIEAIAEQRLEQVRDAVRRSRYDFAFRVAARIAPKTLDREQRAGLEDALWSAMTRRRARPSDDLRAYEGFLRFAEIGPADDVRAGRIAHALVGRAAALSSMGKRRQAIVRADEALARIGGGREKWAGRSTVRLMQIKAEALVAGRSYDAALAVHREIDDRFGRSRDPRLMRILAECALARIDVLVSMRQPDLAITSADRLIARLDEAAAPDLALRAKAARASLERD